LRQAGRSAELDLTGAAFGKQLKRADRSGAPWAVVIGEGEAEQGVVLLKDLRRGRNQAEAVSLERRLTAEQLMKALSRS
jgi:histidyl-tRNA synthetase